MPTFLVRVSSHSGLPNARELVGIVTASSSSELADVVDEFGDPNNCEYVMLPAGMIFARENAPIIPDVYVETAEHEPDYWSGATMSEDWSVTILGLGNDSTKGEAWLSLADLAFLDGDIH